MFRILLSLSLSLSAAAAIAAPAPVIAQIIPGTRAAIDSADLRRRVEAFAHDSMRGRLTGSPDALRAADMIVAELRRLGATPAMPSGFLQDVPVGGQVLDLSSRIVAGGDTLVAGSDFVAFGQLRSIGLRGAYPTIFMGEQWDTTAIPPLDSVRGRLVVMNRRAPQNITALMQTRAYRDYVQALSAATAVIVVLGETIPPGNLRAASTPFPQLLPPDTGGVRGSMTIMVTTAAAARILGRPAAGATRGTAGRAVHASLGFTVQPMPSRNVVAIIPGRDPRLRGEYVALGAHLDAVGIRPQAADHDSLRASNTILRPQGNDSPVRQPTADESVQVAALIEAARAARVVRPDSINNGADDDASGSMALLEIAEAMLRGNRPRRSMLLVWHTGEEQGLFGARHFTENSPVPRDSIVAQLNMDMIGRGQATDVTGQTTEGTLLRGGPDYLQLIGSRRLSTELGDLIETVNRDRRAGLRFDYAIDAPGHPQNIYCRSDHYMYARFGIPIVFFTTGGHRDYHQATDEAQYLDYPHLQRVTQLVHDVAWAVGERDARPVVDKPKPDPSTPCRQ
jgi:hypothetical protein